MNQYQTVNAIDKIIGYFHPSPSKHGDNETEFECAKSEGLKHLREQVKHVESITYAKFTGGK